MYLAYYHHFKGNDNGLFIAKHKCKYLHTGLTEIIKSLNHSLLAMLSTIISYTLTFALLIIPV